MRLVTDTENLFDEKKLKLQEINLQFSKDTYFLSNSNSNGKIEEEEQEETIANLSQEKKEKKRKKGKVLNIEIITSSYITKGNIIKLTSEGYAQGARKIKDGITYFGYEEPDKIDSENVSIF